MIIDLDDPATLDAMRAGAKATVLAQAHRIGLPVLPGFVVEASASSRHMKVGAAALALRGSGGARLAVMAEPIIDRDEMVGRGRRLGASLVARSSSPLEGAGEWAGAFASYLEITPDELPKAVVGCWASAFSVDALARMADFAVEPGTSDMAVLVQPAIQAVCGGVAEIEPDGGVVVHAVAGPPLSLLQGGEKGVTARRPADGRWAGEGATALIGEEYLDRLRSVLELAAARFGVNRCEWAVGDRLWLLQLDKVTRPASIVNSSRPATSAELIPVVRAIVAVPGAHGAEAMSLSTRVGVRPWEPLVAAVVLDHGTVSQGTPAAPGIGAGLRHHVARVEEGTPHRAVVSAGQALPDLSQHIWDAAGLVTGTGSPGAHVFETARSLGVPAVCGVDISGEGDLIIAVDGHSGLVATLPLGAQPSP